MTESQLLLQEHVDLSYSQDEDDPLIGFTINFLPSSTSYSDSQDAPRGGTGSQVLPVASLADDWNDVPATGDEYLFLVRRELSGLSPVTRVVNPYHQEFPPESISQHKPVREDRPSQVWRKAFLDQFVAMRDRLANEAPPLSSFPPPSADCTFPLPKEGANGWKVFINGKVIKSPSSQAPEPSLPNPPPPPPLKDNQQDEFEEMSLEDTKAALLASLELDVSSPPATLPPPPQPQSQPQPQPQPQLQPAHELPPTTVIPTAETYTYDPNHLPHLPTPSLLLSLSQPQTINLLRYLSEWLQSRYEIWEEESSSPGEWVGETFIPSSPSSTPPPPLPTPHEIQWILSLLSHLSSLLQANHISILRELTKLVKELIRGNSETGVRDGVKWDKDAEDLEEVRAGGWMIVVAVAGVWGQKDLWEED